MGGRRSRAFVLILVVLAVALAGCVAKKEETRDEVLRSWSRDKPTDRTSEVTISVPQDAERLRFSVSTKPPKDGGSGFDWGDYGGPCYSWPCNDDDSGSDETSGYVSVTLWDPQNNEQGNIKLNHDSSDSLVLHDPLPGNWLAQIGYFSYDGPVALSATEPAKTSGAALFGGSFWDITGVILALATITGGWLLYRRRGQFLSREMHRIDHTFRDHSDDVEECRQNLMDMKDHLSSLLVRRKLEESQYLILEKRIDRYLHDLEVPGNRHEGRGEEGAAGRKSAVERFRRTQG